MKFSALNAEINIVSSSWTQKVKVWIMVFSAAFNNMSVISWWSV